MSAAETQDQDENPTPSETEEKSNEAGATKDDEIVVTGTRIPRQDFEGQSPITVVQEVGEVDFRSLTVIPDEDNVASTIADAPVWLVGLVGIVGVLLLVGVLRIRIGGSPIENLMRVTCLLAGSLLLGLVVVYFLIAFGSP